MSDNIFLTVLSISDKDMLLGSCGPTSPVSIPFYVYICSELHKYMLRILGGCQSDLCSKKNIAVMSRIRVGRDKRKKDYSGGQYKNSNEK